MKKAIIFVCLLLLGFILGMRSPALAFDRGIHQDITKEVLSKYTLNGVGPFSDPAIKVIAESNYHVDDPQNQDKSEMHFDNENFSGGSKRLRDLKAQVITEAKNQESGYRTHTRLGQALHTVQDFYAHSNWVELQNQESNSELEINKELGRREISNVADENAQTCDTDKATLKSEGLRKLTSGYFKSLLSPCEFPNEVRAPKCLHGWSYTLPQKCPGINKDNDTRPGYNIAITLAVKATEDYLDQILKEPPLEGNVESIKFVMGIK